MENLFNQLSKENQEKVRNHDDSRLFISLSCKHYKHYLTILDMMDLSEQLGVDFGILSISKLFKS